jgi:hypothetical protein
MEGRLMSDTDSNDTEQKPDGYHYARGRLRAIAEEKYHQPRQERLIDYWNRPTGEDVVQSMVKKGWSEEQARDAVRYLWLEQMPSVDTDTNRQGDQQ